MFRALQYVIIVVAAFMTVSYLAMYQPGLTNRLLLSLDVFGITQVSQLEKERIEKIRRLTIPYEEKVVLMNRTVFMQASQDMVKLALGEPKDSKPDTGEVVRYFYYLGEDKRPTVLVFQQNKLVQAYKGSSLDLPAELSTNKASLPYSPLDTPQR